MINLLPSKQKEKVAKKRSERAISVLVFFLASFFLILSLSTFMVRAYGLFVLEKEAASVIEKKGALSDIERKEEIINEFNAIALSISSVEEKKIDFSSIVSDIYEIFPDGVKVRELEFERDHPTAGDDTFILSGRADNWDLLLSFENLLEENYSEVNFSPGSWSSTRDIEFFVNFKIDESDE